MNAFETLRTALGRVVPAAALAGVLLGGSLPAFAASPDLGNPDPNTLDIAGSTTVYPIVETSKTRFPNTAPGAVMNVAQGGSGAGQIGIMNGSLDIGMSSSSCKTSNESTYTCAQLVKDAIARDAVSVIVNVNAPCNIASLSKADIQQIWGTTPGWTNWNQLPGCSANQPLRIIAREIGSGTRQSFLELVPITDAAEQAKITAHGERKNGSPAVEAAVDADPLAIGYAGLHFVGGNNKAVAVAGVMPSDETVSNGTYTMSRSLWLFTLPTSINPKPLIQTYRTWVLGHEAQAIVNNEGYVPVGPSAPDWDVNLDRIGDIGDVAVIGVSWQATNAVSGWIRADLNWDNIVDIGDVAAVGVKWLATW
jgi:phosphate transport system substrate-binding protein